MIKNNYKYGIISKSGIEIVKPDYNKIETKDKYDSYIKISNNNLYGILYHTLFVFVNIYDEIFLDFQGKLCSNCLVLLLESYY